MILVAIINIIFPLLGSLLGIVDIDISLASEFMSKIGEFFSVACYLLPMPTVISILGITVILINFRIVIALLKTLWAILPLV